MNVIQNIDEWQTIRQSVIKQNASIGFVPTMGNLHKGHFSLYQNSLQENDLTIASIFINPTQFNQEKDFQNYPKTLERDIQNLTSLGVDYCLLPEYCSLYPDGYRYQINETGISQEMEGQHRPGHFTGVLTIVMKLFNIIKPQKAYFGQKDFQQAKLIEGMVKDFFMDIKVITCPTIRETSGLACSSRNNLLNSKERLLAEQFAELFHQPKPIELIRQQVESLGIKIDYLKEENNHRFAAVNIGNIRLIDNYSFEAPKID